MKSWNCAEKIRVLVVDDHPTVREGLRSLIDRQQDVVVCGECSNASDALAKVAELRPDVATVDINLGSESGLELIARMRAMAPALKILALSMHEDCWHRESAATAGAHDYVTKREATQSLVSKIRQVIQPRTADRIVPQAVALKSLLSKPTSKFVSMKNIIPQLHPVAAIIMMCGISSVQAATLTSVPMQGSMVMPMVAYHADLGHLHVTMPPEVPQLTPLLVSNPSDSFDLADPWYDALDSSREGRAFSRRYGFVMDTVTDPLPQGTGIVIRKLSGAPQLGFYRAHAMSLPHLWQPLFGTDGTTNVFSWNASMFHPCVTAAPGTNAYEATFDAFLVSTNTGVAVPGSNTDPFTLNWTTVPDGRPVLSIGQKMIIAWPALATNCVLECADSMPAAEWTTVTNTPVMLDGQSVVILDGSAGRRFFRMRITP